MSPERPIPKDPRRADQERIQRLANASQLIAPVGDTPLFELEDFSEDTDTTEERDPRQRDSGFLWLEEEIGSKWRQALGISGDTRPGMLDTTQAILNLLGLPVDSSRMLVIIEGWLSGDQTLTIVNSHADIPNKRFVNNKISTMKRKIRRHVNPEEFHIHAEDAVGKRADEWLIDVYGLDWWKKFGFESRGGVVVETLVDELFRRLKLVSPSPELKEQFTDWIGGESLSSIAGSNTGATALGPKIRAVKDELRDTELLARAEREKAVKQRVASGVGRHSLGSSVRVTSQERPAKEPGLAEKWAERLGLNERMTKELRQYLHPNGPITIDRDTYQAVRYLTGYVKQAFGSLDNEAIEVTDDQRDMLREILGIDRNNRTKRPGMPMYQSVARFIRDFPQLIYGFTPERERAALILGAFQSVLDADTARLASEQQG